MAVRGSSTCTRTSHGTRVRGHLVMQVMVMTAVILTLTLQVLAVTPIVVLPQRS